MDDVTIELFSRMVDSERLQRCLMMLDEYLDFASAEFRVSGDTETNDRLFRFEDIKTGEWRESYDEFGRLFFDLDSAYGGISNSDGFEHLTVVLKKSTHEPGSLIDLFGKVSVLFQADFSFVFGENRGSGEYFDVSYSSNDEGLGLAAGLRDVYWLNFYGETFVKLIGAENICELPAFEISETDSGIFVQVSERVEDAYRFRIAIKNQIGNQYFVPKGRRLEHVDSGGVLRLARHLLTVIRSPKNLAVAEVRPQFEGEGPYQRTTTAV